MTVQQGGIDEAERRYHAPSARVKDAYSVGRNACAAAFPSLLKRVGDIRVLATLVFAAACNAPATTSGTSSSATTTPAMASASTAGLAPSGTDAAAPAQDDLVGKPAPDFTTTAQDGTPVHLAALKGKRVVLYFYPKDETAGCTKEACSFRDAWQRLSKTGAVLVGVSADTTDSHKAFVAHYQLPFLLVSDPDGTIGGAYGVPFAGHHQRQTVIIGPDGNVFKVYRKVDVAVHAAQVLDDLTSS
jgi:peroxiredoxin Q/BCP